MRQKLLIDLIRYLIEMMVGLNNILKDFDFFEISILEMRSKLGFLEMKLKKIVLK